jgi:hypothetical protein
MVYHVHGPEHTDLHGPVKDRFVDVVLVLIFWFDLDSPIVPIAVDKYQSMPFLINFPVLHKSVSRVISKTEAPLVLPCCINSDKRIVFQERVIIQCLSRFIFEFETHFLPRKD